MRRDQHVLPIKEGWAVRPEGEMNYSSVHKTWDEAIEAARKTAKKEKAEIIIHKQPVGQQNPESINKDIFQFHKK